MSPDTSDSAIQHDSVEFDKHWQYATGLSGITMMVASMNAVQDPGLLTASVALGLAVVFLLIVYALSEEAIEYDE